MCPFVLLYKLFLLAIIDIRKKRENRLSEQDALGAVFKSVSTKIVIGGVEHQVTCSLGWFVMLK